MRNNGRTRNGAAVNVLSLLALLWTATCLASTPDWENLQVQGRDRLPGHAQLVPYATRAQALAADPIDPFPGSPWYQSLDGTWSFHWSPQPSAVPAGFPGGRFRRRGVEVASRCRATGRRRASARRCIRTIRFPFQVDPPRVMGTPPAEFTNHDARNPTGAYRRWFELPADWHGRHVLLNFDGVDSAFHLWINGQAVGYAQGSRTPAEFDVTRFLHPGSQPAGGGGLPLQRRQLPGRPGHVAAERHLPPRLPVVARRPAYRRTWACARRWTRSTSTRDCSWTIDLDNAGRVGAGRLGAGAADRPGRPRGRQLEQAGARAGGAGSRPRLTIDEPIDHPALWTAETPSLYTLLLTTQRRARPARSRWSARGSAFATCASPAGNCASMAGRS